MIIQFPTKKQFEHPLPVAGNEAEDITIDWDELPKDGCNCYICRKLREIGY